MVSGGADVLAPPPPSTGVRVFPAHRRYVDVASGQRRRHHLDPGVVQRAMARAVRASGIGKRATCHTLPALLRDASLEAWYDIRTVQELLGHSDVSTTMIYTHVLNRGRLGVKSPIDVLPGDGSYVVCLAGILTGLRLARATH